MKAARVLITRRRAALPALLLLVAASSGQTQPGTDLLRHVDPRIGVQGIGEGGTVIGPATLPAEQDSPAADERAEAHQYQVRLTRWGIQAQVTPTRHAAIYRFTFPASEQAHLVFNAVHHISGDIAKGMFTWHDKPIKAELNLSEDGRSITGRSTYTGGFSGPYTLFYAVAFERTPTAFGTWRNDQVQTSAQRINSTPGVKEQLGAFVRFDTTANAEVQMKVAVSFHSVDRAQELLTEEIPAWDFEAVRAAAATTWRETLSAFDITGGSEAERTIFYTAAYHAHLMPRDRTADFARYNPKVPMWDDHYAVWDTWRTLFPLLSIVRPDVVRDTVNSFIERQRVDGAVSDTFIAGVNSWREQGGNGVDMIVADAHAKGIQGVDWKAAYGVMKHNADQRRTGPHFDDPKKGPGPYRSTGWIPAGIMSTSMSLEYSYNDFAASQVAASLGHADDAKRYAERSRQWVNLWNPATTDDGFSGFIMARNADLSWLDFDTRKYSGSWKPYLYESNPWTYSYFVPHQVARLVGLMDGKPVTRSWIRHAQLLAATRLAFTMSEQPTAWAQASEPPPSLP